ncbi:MAG: ABC transporter ATP-binding protein [Cyclobacteriaceae bacterium]|jgi:phospholipid/cholesterol/gamma-HCH transport system ATP-binding protein|nr:ATP-binding cassette domain-containing protein [Flammeovirgaceae bacterium]
MSSDAQTYPSVVSIRNLHKSFGSNHVLRGFHLDVAAGENVAVMGKSGSGKSVLIKCIIGLEPIDEGQLIVLGKDVPKLSVRELDALRADVGFQFQGSALYDSMTVRENLEFPLRRHLEKIKGYRTEDLVKEALENVGLLNAIDLLPSELSGGMKKRIALARTIIMRPKLILYDEPTSGLDPITAREISRLIVDIQKQYQAASVVITHDLACARITGNRLVILADGNNYAEGKYEEVERMTDPVVHSFFT